MRIFCRFFPLFFLANLTLPQVRSIVFLLCARYIVVKDSLQSDDYSGFADVTLVTQVSSPTLFSVGSSLDFSAAARLLNSMSFLSLFPCQGTFDRLSTFDLTAAAWPGPKVVVLALLKSSAELAARFEAQVKELKAVSEAWPNCKVRYLCLAFLELPEFRRLSLLIFFFSSLLFSGHCCAHHQRR